jgi:hypothetical protein
LVATGEIPQLDKTTGTDGKARPIKGSRKQRLGSTWDDADLEDLGVDDDVFEDSKTRKRESDSEKRKRRNDREWEEGLGLRPGELALKQAKMEHAIGLIEAGVDPRSEKVSKLLLEASVHIIKDSGYDPFHGRSDQEVRDWHLFILFLVVEHGYPVDGAGMHVEWVLQRPFQNVDEWLGDEGAKFRKGWRPRAVSPQIMERWRAFLDEHAGKSTADICAMLEERAAHAA